MKQEKLIPFQEKDESSMGLWSRSSDFWSGWQHWWALTKDGKGMCPGRLTGWERHHSWPCHQYHNFESLRIYEKTGSNLFLFSGLVFKAITIRCFLHLHLTKWPDCNHTTLWYITLLQFCFIWVLTWRSFIPSFSDSASNCWVPTICRLWGHKGEWTWISSLMSS